MGVTAETGEHRCSSPIKPVRDLEGKWLCGSDYGRAKGSTCPASFSDSFPFPLLTRPSLLCTCGYGGGWCVRLSWHKAGAK